MTARYSIPNLPGGAEHCTELLVRRSRFIATSGHAPDTESARAFIDAIRRAYPDATHNCWAFAAGPPGDTARVGFSDDGEPHGTAGRPMLAVLLHAPVGETVCVVTRYFGGVKLGTGGLVRAYQQAVRENFDTLPLRERIVPAFLEVVVEYPYVDRLRRLLPAFEAQVEEEHFAVDASFRIALPHEHAADFSAALAEQTDGAALVEPWVPSVPGDGL